VTLRGTRRSTILAVGPSHNAQASLVILTAYSLYSLVAERGGWSESPLLDSCPFYRYGGWVRLWFLVTVFLAYFPYFNCKFWEVVVAIFPLVRHGLQRKRETWW
jgi:hypothetical protein